MKMKLNKMSNVGNLMKERREVEQKLEKIKSKKLTIEEALEFEPNLLEFLRKEYEGFLSVGEISSEETLYSGHRVSCNKESIQILGNGYEVGVYSRYIKPDGKTIVSHSFEGKYFLTTHFGERRDNRTDITFP